MRKLKQITADLKAATFDKYEDLQGQIWQLICYPPKMPARQQQEQLLNEAERFTLTVTDRYFANRELSFNVFKWGAGKNKVLITHGWGSKAADFSELITSLRQLNDVEVMAFDAPGNGSSEGELSNLLLFAQAVESLIGRFGAPKVLIGHSLGAIANIMALNATGLVPALLVSIAPLIRLKENFEASMQSAGLSESLQQAFLADFEARFGTPASYFSMDNLYRFGAQMNHWILCDRYDKISPYPYLQEFLKNHPAIHVKYYDEAGHEKIIRLPALHHDLLQMAEAAMK